LDLNEYRESAREKERINNLMNQIPHGYSNILEIGARDGYITRLLSDYFEEVTALDLQKPNIDISNVITVKGDVTNLEFPDNYFDVVLCAEVLEHIPTKLLKKACDEIARVAKYAIVIGVPYKQDIRNGRTTCIKCGGVNPPWGHVNIFDEQKLKELFCDVEFVSKNLVGKEKDKTNIVSAFLMNLAGNPWGTYNQEETCIYCDSKLVAPAETTLFRQIFAKTAYIIKRIQSIFITKSPIWIHATFRKNNEYK